MTTNTGETPAAPAPPPPPASRAGRNLLHAVGIGLFLGALVIVTLLTYKVAFLVVVCIAVPLGSMEMARALSTGGTRVLLPPVVGGTVAMIVAAYVWGGQGLAVAFVATLVVVLVWRTFLGVDGVVADVAASVLSAAYPGFLAGFAAMMLAPGDGVKRIFFFVLLAVASDVGGYAVGVLIGRHPLAPRISPKKSWEGFGGSLAFCAVAGALTMVFSFGSRWWEGALAGMAVAAVATLGDLVESVIKRDLGIKDMGTILPGHGGFMDRLDSLVLVAPLAWSLLALLVPVTS